MSTTVGVIYDSTPRIRRHHRAGHDEQASADIAAEALDAFTPHLLVPFDLGMTVACLDEGGESAVAPAHRPVQWHRYLRRTPLPLGVEAGPFYIDATVSEVASIDGEHVRATARELLDQSCEDTAGTDLSWTQLYVTSTWVRLVGHGPDERSVIVDDLDGHRLALDVPVTLHDGVAGIAGPYATVGLAPVELWFHNDGAWLELDIDVRWSFWNRAGLPGRDALDLVLAKLEAQGWSSDEPGT